MSFPTATLAEPFSGPETSLVLGHSRVTEHCPKPAPLCDRVHAFPQAVGIRTVVSCCQPKPHPLACLGALVALCQAQSLIAVTQWRPSSSCHSLVKPERPHSSECPTQQFCSPSKFSFMYCVFCLLMCLCTTCMPDVHGDQKEDVGSLRLESQRVVSH